MEGKSPALAKKFFPNYGSDDYKAIDKGRNTKSMNQLRINTLINIYFKK